MKSTWVILYQTRKAIIRLTYEGTEIGIGLYVTTPANEISSSVTIFFADKSNLICVRIFWCGLQLKFFGVLPTTNSSVIGDSFFYRMNCCGRFWTKVLFQTTLLIWWRIRKLLVMDSSVVLFNESEPLVMNVRWRMSIDSLMSECSLAYPPFLPPLYERVS